MMTMLSRFLPARAYVIIFLCISLGEIHIFFSDFSGLIALKIISKVENTRAGEDYILTL